MAVIAVFGSAIVQPNDREYSDSVAVGAALAKAGYDVLTGGYYGVMEAASKGAAEAGGHVIGVRAREVEEISNSQINTYVHQAVDQPTLRERLRYIFGHADGFVAMNGGIGTLQEIIETWQLIRIGAIPQNPFICYGEFWQPILQYLLDSPYVQNSEQTFVHFATTPEQVVHILQNGR